MLPRKGDEKLGNPWDGTDRPFQLGDWQPDGEWSKVESERIRLKGDQGGGVEQVNTQGFRPNCLDGYEQVRRRSGPKGRRRKKFQFDHSESVEFNEGASIMNPGKKPLKKAGRERLA